MSRKFNDEGASSDTREPSHIIVDNSPIEFVVVGPRDGEDVVLAASHDAKLDLIGLAIPSTADKRHHRQRTLSRTLVAPSRQLNVVLGGAVSDRSGYRDSRESTMRFAWVGPSSTLSREAVEDEFRRISTELKLALDEDDDEKVERYLSQVIFQCSDAVTRLERLEKLKLVVLLIYGVVLAMGLVGWWLLVKR